MLILITFCLDYYCLSVLVTQQVAVEEGRAGLSQTIKESQAWAQNMSTKFTSQKSQHTKVTVFTFSVLLSALGYLRDISFLIERCISCLLSCCLCPN